MLCKELNAGNQKLISFEFIANCIFAANMQSLITSYLLQNRECVLPHIGIIKIESKPAEPDHIKKQMLPPAEEINFRENATLQSPGLIKYIASKKNITEDEASVLLDDFCNEWKQKIHAGDRLIFETFGSLQKNAASNFYFKREKNFNFLQPVPAERVIPKNAAHGILTADGKTNSAAMNGYFSEDNVAGRSGWGLWAGMLAAVAIGIMLYYFFNHKLSTETIGNQNHFVIDSPLVNHFNPGE